MFADGENLQAILKAMARSNLRNKMLAADQHFFGSWSGSSLQADRFLCSGGLEIGEPPGVALCAKNGVLVDFSTL